MNKHLQKLFFLIAVIASVLTAKGKDVVFLAKEGRAMYSIALPQHASDCEKFAAFELQKYLSEISRANFRVSDKIQQKSIVVAAVSGLKSLIKTDVIPCLLENSYIIFKRGETIYLSGSDPGSTLSAVYDFLDQLGCRWVAPDFEFYQGVNKLIPFKKDLSFSFFQDQIKQPAFKYRKLYIEEGKSHDLQNLLQLIDWMPKNHFNILVIPTNYQGNGKVKWDNWRTQLIPELKKRGIRIEVGGHGYQNFLNSSMKDGKLFGIHPEWFALNDSGKRTMNSRYVFCTSNKNALKFLLTNILKYLQAHPEIEIFDFWPPDRDLWCECPSCKSMGSPSERHALLVDQTAKFLNKNAPGVKLECLAYSRYTEPPLFEIPENVLVDFCPINQSFEFQIYDDSSSNNRMYRQNLLKWLGSFHGDMSLYSYYRKYGWRSLPNLIPHYMQNDLQFYQKSGVRGISVYSEPGDWFTYGLNHYVLGQLAFDPNVNVDKLINDYSTIVFGPAATDASLVFSQLEEIVRYGCSLPNTKVKSTVDYKNFIQKLDACRAGITKAIFTFSSDKVICSHLHRLELIVTYAIKNIELNDAKNNSGSIDQIEILTKEIKNLLLNNAELGIFIPPLNL